MRVTFRTTKLEKCYRKLANGEREWNPQVARRYIERINLLKATAKLGDLPTGLPYRYHVLKYDKKGRHCLYLTREWWRLEFTVETEDPLTVRIEKVSKHYD